MSSNSSLRVEEEHVRRALSQLLLQFETQLSTLMEKIPPMLRPMVEQIAAAGTLRDTDGSMGHTLWLLLQKEVLKDGG